MEMKSIEELGKEGEQFARLKLKEKGYWIGQIDWLGKRNGEWTKFEIKRKERFNPPPFEGHGLDRRQIDYSNELFQDTGIRTYLLIYEIGTNIWYGQYLDILEAGSKFDTKNGVRIYKLDNFEPSKRGHNLKNTPEDQKIRPLAKRI
jgi:hypothetical protein